MVERTRYLSPAIPRVWGLYTGLKYRAMGCITRIYLPLMPYIRSHYSKQVVAGLRTVGSGFGSQYIFLHLEKSCGRMSLPTLAYVGITQNI